MNNDAFGAEFGAMTDDEQVQTLGGDGEFAHMVGWFVGFAGGCVRQALIAGTDVMTHQPIIYVGGYGIVR